MASDLRSHFGAFTVAFTKGPGDGTILAKRFIGNGRRFLIACGGDGTINEVANGIIESKQPAELGILPAGTGGDFRRSLGMSAATREAAQELRDGKTALIDVGKATFLGHDGKEASRHFINIASLGLSASINQRVKDKGEYQWIPSETVRGKTKFAVSTVQEIIEKEYRSIKFKADDADEKTVHTINFCICNARFFGGGMKIAPEASVTDGQFDVINIGDINTAKIMFNGYKLYRGTHLDLPEVKMKHARRVEVTANDSREQIDIELDGELPGTLPATFEIVPNALRVRVPAGE